MSNHYLVPDISSDYVLNPERGWFSLIRPEATTNLVINPSVETSIFGYTDTSFGAIARVTSHQRRGAWSMEGTAGAGNPDEGVVYAEVGLTAGTTYTFSVDVWATAGIAMKIHFASNVGTQIGTAKQFRGTSLWQRVWVTYTETASANRYLYIVKDNDTRAVELYVDGLQVEAKSYPTTYCDGDLRGFLVNENPVAYIWNGTPHLSTSSRSAQTRTGGRVINLDDYDFQVNAYTGLGMPGLNNVATSFGLQDGALYQRTIAQPRTFVLSGTFETDGFQQLQRQRAQLIKDVSRDIVANQQPMLLRYHPYKCSRAIGDEYNIVCNYASGLEGNIDNLYRERVPLQFTAFLPAVQRAGDSGDELTTLSNITDADYALYRSNEGLWQALSTGFNGEIQAIAYRLDGTIVLGGAFSSAGGVACNNIAIYNPDTNTFSALGVGVNDLVQSLLVLPDNSTVVGGAFTLAGGAAANRIALVSSGGTWSTFGTGFNGQILALARLSNGNILAGGNYTTANGAASLNLSVWNGATWSQLDGGANGAVRSLLVDTDGVTIYAGGSFTTINAVAANRIARRSAAGVWSALGSGMNSYVAALALGSDGTLYAGGQFNTPFDNIAAWNGVAWSDLGGGVDNEVTSLAFTASGSLLVGGWFGTAGSITLPSVGLAQWSGSDWSIVDVILPSLTTIVFAIAIGTYGSITIGFDVSGTAQTSVTNVSYQGNANAYPRITITGPTTGASRLFQLLNRTTGNAIYLNYDIIANETLILDLTPGNISFTSNLQGNILSAIVPGSTLAFWHLQPGNNIISFLADDSTVTATMVWQDRFWSLDSSVV